MRCYANSLLIIFISIYFNNLAFARSLTVVSDIKNSIALANIAVNLIDNLKDSIHINYLKKPGLFDLTDIKEEVASVLNAPFDKPGDMAIFFDILWTPGRCSVSYVPNSKIKIAYSMFESSEIIAEWVDILNTKFDAVIVPDPWLIRVYKRSGVKIPIYVLPLMLDLSKYLNSPVHVRNNIFRFGMIGSYAGGGHKNHAMLIEAFCRQFANRNNVELVIHSRTRVEALHDITNKYNARNVVFIEEELTESDYFNLIKSFDCYVLLSKGEGFSITPRQALALGIPCVLSNCAAQTTICERKIVRAVPANIQEVAYYPHLGKTAGFFMNCSLADAEAALIDVYDNYDHWLALAKKGRLWVAQYCSNKLRRDYLSFINFKTIKLGSVNSFSDRAIITDSIGFYTKMRSLDNKSLKDNINIGKVRK